MTQTIVAFFILGISVIYVAKRSFGAFAPKKKPCGCGGCGCGGNKTAARKVSD